MLSFFNVQCAIHILSPTEKHQPGLLYLTSSVPPITLLHQECTYLTRKLEHTVTRLVVDRELFDRVSTAVTTPLAVIAVHSVIIPQEHLTTIA
ncbi:hypothetical protein PAXRUDRAFT_728361 [Paxillus rubicundulus Ve08.2h10]|uniref:Uncharacterized protein n=1 Tax=Paxillus rubicundulus Ve08.2h10 TaxID=930991 RepID=A0A0D0DKB6_9AGAM|nr:hypothetical protein PAXRUDRAFT_728361 [Paxillus rubicundulus Ve08.2h10]